MEVRCDGRAPPEELGHALASSDRRAPPEELGHAHGEVRYDGRAPPEELGQALASSDRPAPEELGHAHLLVRSSSAAGRARPRLWRGAMRWPSAAGRVYATPIAKSDPPAPPGIAPASLPDARTRATDLRSGPHQPYIPYAAVPRRAPPEGSTPRPSPSRIPPHRQESSPVACPTPEPEQLDFRSGPYQPGVPYAAVPSAAGRVYATPIARSDPPAPPRIAPGSLPDARTRATRLPLGSSPAGRSDAAVPSAAGRVYATPIARSDPPAPPRIAPGSLPDARTRATDLRSGPYQPGVPYAAVRRAPPEGSTPRPSPSRIPPRRHELPPVACPTPEPEQLDLRSGPHQPYVPHAADCPASVRRTALPSRALSIGRRRCSGLPQTRIPTVAWTIRIRV